MGTFSGMGNVKAFKMDLGDEAEVKAAAARLKGELPGGLYGLVLNNNNTVVGRDGLVEWMNVENYQWCVASSYARMQKAKTSWSVWITF